MHDRGDDDFFVPNNNEGVIDDDDEAHTTNNYVTLDGEDGDLIMADGSVEYDDFNIPNTVEHFRMGERHQSIEAMQEEVGHFLCYVSQGIGWNQFQYVDMGGVCQGFHEQHRQLAQPFGEEACRRSQCQGTDKQEEEEEGISGNYTSNRITPRVDSHYSSSLIY
jgi:hypothetical protein